MRRNYLSSTDREELSRLVTDAVDPIRIVWKVSMLQPRAVYEVEDAVRWFPHSRRQGWAWLRSATKNAIENNPHALVLMFNWDGYVREAALKAINNLPDTPFFLAALVRRLNDWVEPVRRAAEECANRELPRLSARTIVGAAPFLLERMPHWGRWSAPPSAVLETLARPDCLNELALQFAKTAELPAAALRAALRFGLLDDHLLSLSRTAVRPEFRAIALKAMLDGEVTWVTHYERQWVDKRYFIARRVPVLGRRSIVRPSPVDALIRQGAADRSPLVRRGAAYGLIQHAASLENVTTFFALFDRDKSPSVRWCISYLARRNNNYS